RNHDMIPTLKDIAVYTEGCSTYDLPAETAAQLSLPKTTIHPQKIAHHIGLYTMAERGAFIASAIAL
ncbi:MAG: isochorismatase, partial [Merismopedia sp. SIO2A8]|nr:isochorismatase [Merismopedia sp. SIO2A8]